MTDARLLRTTLEAVDEFVDRVRRGLAATLAATPSDAEPRLVIDEGRAAAEWTVDVDMGDRFQRIGLLVVCDVADDRLTDARLYVAPTPRESTDR